MHTVVHTETVVGTVKDTQFSSSATHVIQNNRTSSGAKASKAEGLGICGRIELKPDGMRALYFLLYCENPSCLHTTPASKGPQALSHTVPQALLLHTSTRPSKKLGLPASLTAPCTQTVCAD